MNNGTLESLHADRANGSMRPARSTDELTQLKQQLLKAEVRLARARATAVGAEVDIKVLSARLKAAVS